MTIRASAAALVGGLVFVLATASAAHADAVRLRDGKWLPKQLNELKEGEEPGDEVLQDTASAKVSALGCDTVKIGGTEVSAGLVAYVILLECAENADFAQGESDGAGGYFDDAAQAFGRAAEQLRGSAKQLALGKRAVALAQGNDPKLFYDAIELLKAEFPKAFMLPDLLTRKARGLLSGGDTAGAKAALDAITSLPGVNKRELYAAEVEKVRLFQVAAAGNDMAKLAEAEKAFRGLVQRMDGESAREEIASVRLAALVGVGRMLALQGKGAEARPVLQQVIDTPGSEKDTAMIGGAYAALGKAVLAEANTKQQNAKSDAERKDALTLLETAQLHFLRVTELYGERAERGDLFDARLETARTFATMFTLSKDTDCDAGKHAYTYFGAAYRMMPGGGPRNLVAKEAQELKARLDKACGKPAPTKPK